MLNINNLKEIFADCDIKDGKVVVFQNAANLIKCIKEKYSFDILKSITAVDNNGEFELIYRIYSSMNDEEVIISTTVNGEAESVSEIFESAIADEREIYDLYGIVFKGHKDLKRLYMPQEWIGHPLKKDYTENDERLKWND